MFVKMSTHSVASVALCGGFRCRLCIVAMESMLFKPKFNASSYLDMVESAPAPMPKVSMPSSASLSRAASSMALSMTESTGLTAVLLHLHLTLFQFCFCCLWRHLLYFNAP